MYKRLYRVNLRSASGMELENESLVEVTVLMEGLPLPIKPPDAVKQNNVRNYHLRKLIVYLYRYRLFELQVTKNVILFNNKRQCSTRDL